MVGAHIRNCRLAGGSRIDGCVLGTRNRRDFEEHVLPMHPGMRALGGCFFAAATGYVDGAEPNSQLRFRILHEVGFPLVTLALLATWIRIMWRPGNIAKPSAAPDRGGHVV